MGGRCPECGEWRMDYLVWDETGDFVRCTSCGKEYDPLAECHD